METELSKNPYIPIFKHLGFAFQETNSISEKSNKDSVCGRFVTRLFQHSNGPDEQRTKNVLVKQRGTYRWCI